MSEDQQATADPVTPQAMKPLACILLKSAEFQGKNTPFTRFQFAGRLRGHLLKALEGTFVTDKNFEKHFQVTVANDGVRAQALTREASDLIEMQKAAS